MSWLLCWYCGRAIETIINAGTLKQKDEPGFVAIDFVRQFVQFYKFLEDGAIEPAERVNLTGLS